MCVWVGGCVHACVHTCVCLCCEVHDCLQENAVVACMVVCRRVLLWL